MYKIGIWDKDESYLWGLVGYLKEHHKDTFEINVAEGGFGLDPVDIDAVHYDALFLGNSAEDCIDMEKVPSDTMIVHLSEEDAEDRLKIGIHGGLEHVYKQMKKLCENAKNAKNKITEKAEKLVRHDKGAKTAGTGTADGLVMHMIAENAKSKEAGEARQYLLGIQKFCDELLSSLDFDGEDGDGTGPQNGTKEPVKEGAVTYIIRKRTGDKTVINRDLFKMGKDAACVDYCISDNPAVSRNHADIVRRPDGFYLVDKGSLNRTFINGKKLEAGEYRKLDDGDLMQLADDVFEFRSLADLGE